MVSELEQKWKGNENFLYCLGIPTPTRAARKFSLDDDGQLPPGVCTGTRAGKCFLDDDDQVDFFPHPNRIQDAR